MGHYCSRSRHLPSLAFCPLIVGCFQPAIAMRTPVNAGINDWGGVSPITRDFVNPERPWPHIERLAAATARAGKLLLPRLPVYPEYIAQAPDTWLSTVPAPAAGPNPAVDAATGSVPVPVSVYSRVLGLADATGLARASTWAAGAADAEPAASNTQTSMPSHAHNGSAQHEADVQQLERSASQADASHAPAELPASSRGARWDVRVDVLGALEGAHTPAQSTAMTERLSSLHALHDSCLEIDPPARRSSSAAQQLHDSVAEADIMQLLAARGADARAVCEAADRLRADLHGDRVSYVVNRNINYTNVCTFKCGFCAFSKVRAAEELRGKPYLLGCDFTCNLTGWPRLRLLDGPRSLRCASTAVSPSNSSHALQRMQGRTWTATPNAFLVCVSEDRPAVSAHQRTLMRDATCRLDEIKRRVAEAWDRGASEVCLQGGIHPDFSGDTYLEILRACKEAAPGIHVHAFSPLEVSHGAATLGLSLEDFLARLRDAGLGSLPGTAAEVLTDRVRRVICPDKLSAAEWLEVVGAAHRVGLRTTSTIMFGHVDTLQDWAQHLLALRYADTSSLLSGVLGCAFSNL